MIQKKLSYKREDIEGIIFDLDGTLYNQKKMRFYMIFDLFSYYFLRPHKLNDLRVIYYFRKKRDELYSCNNLEQSQYVIVSDILKIPKEEVQRVVSFWIYKRPLKFIKRCKYPYIADLFSKIYLSDLKVSVVSDYPVEEKLKALDIRVDVKICSTDQEINAFKPNPKGFLVASERMGVLPKKCIVVGDRDDKDGEGAKNAGMFFVKINKDINNIFT